MALSVQGDVRIVRYRTTNQIAPGLKHCSGPVALLALVALERLGYHQIEERLRRHAAPPRLRRGSVSRKLAEDGLKSIMPGGGAPALGAPALEAYLRSGV